MVQADAAWRCAAAREESTRIGSGMAAARKPLLRVAQPRHAPHGSWLEDMHDHVKLKGVPSRFPIFTISLRDRSMTGVSIDIGFAGEATSKACLHSSTYSRE